MKVRSLAALLGTAVLLGITFYALAEAHRTPAPTQGDDPGGDGESHRSEAGPGPPRPRRPRPSSKKPHSQPVASGAARRSSSAFPA